MPPVPADLVSGTTAGGRGRQAGSRTRQGKGLPHEAQSPGEARDSLRIIRRIVAAT